MFVLDLFEKEYGYIYGLDCICKHVLYQLIVPIFNKLTPLDKGLLREKLKYTDKEIFFKDIFVIDSKKINKSKCF